LVELLEKKFTTYFISDSGKIISEKLISHFDLNSRTEKISENYLPDKEKITIAVTSGASCPDSAVDDILKKLISFFVKSSASFEVNTNGVFFLRLIIRVWEIYQGEERTQKTLDGAPRPAL